MKKLAIFSLLVALSGCSTDLSQVTGNLNDSKQLFIQSVNKTFDLTSKSDLREVGLLLAKKDEGEGVELVLVSTDFQHFVPLKGEEFDGLKIVYKLGDLYTTAVVPVDPSTSTRGGRALRALTVPACTMKCNASAFCHGCDMTITERCKSLSCTCNQGSGDCSPEITFPQ